MDSDDSSSSRRGSFEGREQDLDHQMRSVSPSTISTASSGSPLVRGHSSSSSSGSNGTGNAGKHLAGSAGRRPAPTSIAAAQLQCQQQRIAPAAAAAAAPIKSATSSSSMAGKLGSSSREDSSSTKMKKKQQHEQENNKSFGYNVAKSIAYRAYRFNEFWTLDKMSYLNLACLLMTLVCLITIVLFSTSTSNQQPASVSTAGSGRALDGRKLDFEELAEPLTAAAHSKDDLFDDYSSSTNRLLPSQQQADYPEADGEAWSPRTTSPAAARTKLRRKSGPEREIEGADSPISPDEENTTKDGGQTATGGGILEPILSQIFKDLELDSVFSPKSATALNNSSSSGRLRPVIRRSKDGATIIISSSFNESSPLLQMNNNETNAGNPLPSLLQKLLPPMLFKQQKSPLFAGDNGFGSGTATITISGRLIEPPQALFAGELPAASGPFPAAFMSGQLAPRPTFRSPFFPEPMGFRMVAAGPSPFASLPFPSSPLGMMLRSMAAETLDATEESQPKKPTGETVRNITTTTAAAADSKQQTNETLSTQASQQQDKIAPKPDNQATNKSQTVNNSSADPEVETFDVSQLLQLKSAAAPRAAGGRFSLMSSPAHHQSVMIFGTNSNQAHPSEHTGFMGLPSIGPHMVMMPSPFVAPPPHVMMMSSQMDENEASGGLPMPFNPILRALFSNLAAEQTNPGEKNKTAGIERGDGAQPSTVRVIRPFFGGPLGGTDMMSSDSSDSPDSDSQMVDRWPQMLARSPARHRPAGDMLSSIMDGSGDMMDPAPSPVGGHSPLMGELVGGEQPSIIRQTFRGPGGMTIERQSIIQEIPNVQQVARGLRSQSISRLASEDESDEPATGSRRAANPRRDDSLDSAPAPAFMPNRMSFIGRLLSDLSRRATDGAPRVLMSRADSIEDQMVDDSGEIRQQEPKIRIASARLRVRPTLSSDEPMFSFNQRAQPMEMVGKNSGAATSLVGGDPLDQMTDSERPDNKQAPPMSLEETLNSMEDRLDKVLSQYTSSSATTPTTIGLAHRAAIITPVEKPKLQEHPYTSPTSPFFGFPTSSSSSAAAATGQQAQHEEKKSSSSSREPRSFTYHSNNELAANLKAAQRREQEQRESESAEMRAESIGRASKFGPFFAPPAGAMGRRLDDGPFGGDGDQPSSSNDEQQPQQQQEVAPVAPTFMEGRAMMPATGSHNKRPTAAAVASGNHFTTIVV